MLPPLPLPDNPLFTLQQKLYYRLRPWRDRLVHPLVVLSAALRVSPNNVSLLGLLAMLGFIATVRTSPPVAVLSLAISIVCDATDGALARHLRIDSDKGKLTDIIVDATTFTLFIIGLVVGGIVTPQRGLLLTAIMLVSKALRIWRHSRLLSSAWHFRPVTGFVPVAAAYVLYVAFALDAVTTLSIVPSVIRATTVILALDTLITLFLLGHRKYY